MGGLALSKQKQRKSDGGWGVEGKWGKGIGEEEGGETGLGM